MKARSGYTGILAVALVWCWGAAPATGRAADDHSDEQAVIRAELRASQTRIQAGRPVWVDFIITNLTDHAIQLQVPSTETANTGIAAQGLPLPHVFSGVGFTALTIQNNHGDSYDTQVSMPPRRPVPVLELAPHASVGLRLELTQFYPALKRPGKYTLTWKPYGGIVTSGPLALHILPERQAVILTDFGKMTMRFYYQEAPNHVANFMELVESKFYDNLMFNRVVPGALIQGGDPKGDRRGIRPDGVRVKAEFSSIPFERGTVGMARSPRDPDSASCQFFICLSRQPAFDGNQTAFGYLVGEESFETLRKIASVPIGPDDRPRQPVYIRTISLENVPARDSGLEAEPAETKRSADPRAGDLVVAGRKLMRQDETSAGDRPTPATAPATAPAAALDVR